MLKEKRFRDIIKNMKVYTIMGKF